MTVEPLRRPEPAEEGDRAELRRAHRQRDEARQRLADAERACDRAARLVADAEAAVAGYGEAQDAIGDALADAIRRGDTASLDDGGTASGAAELAAIRRLGATRLALERLATERDEARDALAECERTVVSAAEALLRQMGAAMAGELLSAKRRAWTLDRELNGLARLKIGLSAGTVEALHSDGSTPRGIGDRPLDMQASDAWTDFRNRLLDDPEATFSDPAREAGTAVPAAHRAG